MKLIDKDAVVAEIEKCYNECLKRAKIIDAEYWNGNADAYRDVLEILNNNIEVKEADLEKEIDEVFFKNTLEDATKKLTHKHLSMIAKHFFELGIATSNIAQKE